MQVRTSQQQIDLINQMLMDHDVKHGGELPQNSNTIVFGYEFEDTKRPPSENPLNSGCDVKMPPPMTAQEIADRERMIDPDELVTVIQQTGCSREKCLLALIKHENFVDAILDLLDF